MMKGLISKVIVIFLITSSFAKAGEKVFPENVKLQELYSGGVFTEGVTVSPDNKVYFVDVRPTKGAGDSLGRTLVFDPNSNKTNVLLSLNGQVNGMKFNKAGKLLMTSRANYGTRSLVELDLKSQEARLLAARYNGKPFNGLNDLTISPNGTIFVTDPRYLGYETRGQSFFGVYAIDKGLNLKLVTDKALKPNGIATSPDGKILYVAEHFINSDNLLEPNEDLSFGPMRVLAFELDGTNVKGQPKVIIDYGTEDGPDGMLTDSEGNLYVAARAESKMGIHVFNSEGDLIAYLKTPHKPTNLAFGRGVYKNKLYITAGGSLYVVNTYKQGWL